MKTITIHGVPYCVNEKNEVFLYKGPTDLCIGSWDTTKQKLSLNASWQTDAQAFLATYRSQVDATSKQAVQKAKELQGIISSS